MRPDADGPLGWQARCSTQQSTGLRMSIREGSVGEQHFLMAAR